MSKVTRHDEIIKILDDCEECSSSGCCYACDDKCEKHHDIRIELGDIRGEFDDE